MSSDQYCGRRKKGNLISAIGVLISHIEAVHDSHLRFPECCQTRRIDERVAGREEDYTRMRRVDDPRKHRDSEWRHL